MRKPLQSLSREDTCHLRSGVCPACNKTLFIIGGLYHHERGSHRRILCIHCLREFGVAPIDGGQAVILHFVMPAHRLASDYNIHSGTLHEPARFSWSKALYPAGRPVLPPS